MAVSFFPWLLDETENGDNGVCLSDGARLHAEHERSSDDDNAIYVLIDGLVAKCTPAGLL
jgi:hypothetical protein